MSTERGKEIGMKDRKPAARRTQSERREETREALVAAALQLFGLQGYESTSLEEIAESCDMTIRPIYYHFGSKLGLFAEVHELMEQKALKALDSGSSVLAWEAFLKLCDDPVFRQIILEEGPNVLGRAHWSTSRHFAWSRALASDEASQGTRTQNDKVRYRSIMKGILERQPNLELKQSLVEEIRFFRNLLG